ncbi:hypothetical protein ABZ897_30220 [Nonomuraea sp. NPDC046802]|uniref:hypothetical protein n=1 Tax=Nonomuraea sp. NPDC046802 TaxID=3154919 RepID=UPI0033D9E211
MDPTIGELPRGDVLVEDCVIAAIAASLGEVDADVIDASGHIVAPGLIRVDHPRDRILVTDVATCRAIVVPSGADTTTRSSFSAVRPGNPALYSVCDVRGRR